MAGMLLLSKKTDFILPADEAATRASVCWLLLTKSNFAVERTLNAEFCSSDGLLPVVRLNGHLIQGYDALCNALEANSAFTGTHVEAASVRSSRRVYLVWLSDILRNIMLYFTWIHESTYQTFTLPRMKRSLPWPLSLYISRKWKAHYKLFFESMGWSRKMLTDVLEDLDGVCFALTQLLGHGPFFFEHSSPGCLDALIFGYWTVLADFEVFSPCKPILARCSPMAALIERMKELCDSDVAHVLEVNTK
ncbi:unnamed protein product [Dicrocoelium dendriticum]|nr:unnamed protein product [Dicrocoelium dendriticum]